jgi:hypothetical protein
MLQIKVETRPWSIELPSRKLEVELTTISRCGAAHQLHILETCATAVAQCHTQGIWHVQCFNLQVMYRSNLSESLSYCGVMLRLTPLLLFLLVCVALFQRECILYW